MLDLTYPFDPDKILRKKKSLKCELLASKEVRVKKKIALLGGSTTAEIKNILELFLLWYGIEPEFYESGFGQYWQDSMFSGKLREFDPNIVFIHTTCRNITKWPTVRDGKEQVKALMDEQMLHYTSMWERLKQDLGCILIQNNFERPAYRLLGNKDISDFRGRANYISRLNQAFYEYSQDNGGFYINDVDYLASSYGHSKWLDAACWYMYGYALNMSAIPEFALSVANIIKSIYGKNKKAFVLDLDNTLWGGTVGDDGVDALVIGPETPDGQMYSAFQEYIKAHKDLGVLLNVCSKNDYANAIAGLEHPDSTLMPEDFTVIKANWETKDRNIAEIADELKIGADTLVFIDDNPAERELISLQIHGAAVPDIGNAEEYIHRIDRCGFFEATLISSEDMSRGEMYKSNIERTEFRRSFESYGDYLKSLEMIAVIRDFEPVYIKRISQLINRSNQFNLTTKRYTESEVTEITKNNNYIRLYGKLDDKFGDNGVVSVVAGEKMGDELHIELWIMSCRVIGREMEFAMLDRLVDEALTTGISKLIGYYYPTAKNGIVRDFYSLMGFNKIREDNSGNTFWSYSLSGHVSKNKAIKVSSS